jgi:hypothetical protein
VSIATTAPTQYRIAVTFDPPRQSAPPPPPPARATTQPPPPLPPPPPPPPARVSSLSKSRPEHFVVRKLRDPLPRDGQQLVASFERDVDEIEREVARKIEARRDALVKELQALQDQYTKAGQLDDALVIRDYLRSGPPGKYSTKKPQLMKR